MSPIMLLVRGQSITMQTQQARKESDDQGANKTPLLDVLGHQLRTKEQGFI